MKPGGDLDERTHSITNRHINVNGGINDLHQVWGNRVVAYNNSIQSGRSQVARYSFQMPSVADRSVTLTAMVKYRRFDQHFIHFGMGRSSSSRDTAMTASAASNFAEGVTDQHLGAKTA